MVDAPPDSRCVDGRWEPGLMPKCIKDGCDTEVGRVVPRGGSRDAKRGALRSFFCDPGKKMYLIFETKYIFYV